MTAQHHRHVNPPEKTREKLPDIHIHKDFLINNLKEFIGPNHFVFLILIFNFFSRFQFLAPWQDAQVIFLWNDASTHLLDSNLFQCDKLRYRLSK